jgi:hypothetical protein
VLPSFVRIGEGLACNRLQAPERGTRLVRRVRPQVALAAEVAPAPASPATPRALSAQAPAYAANAIAVHNTNGHDAAFALRSAARVWLSYADLVAALKDAKCPPLQFTVTPDS